MKHLVGFDLEHRPQRLLDAAAAWAQRTGARLDLLYASWLQWTPSSPEDDSSFLVSEWRKRRDWEEATVSAAVEALPEGIRGEGMALDGRALDLLVERAAPYDTLIVGTHGRTGVSRFFLGSVAERVVRESGKAVLVVPLRDEDVHWNLRQDRLKVVVPIGNDEVLDTLSHVRALGDVDLHIVNVVPAGVLTVPGPAGMPELLDSEKFETDARQRLSLELSKHAMTGQVHVLLRHGDNAGDDIARLAKDVDADLIVMPTHARRGIAHLLLGSVAERVVRLSPCPVLVLRPTPMD